MEIKNTINKSDWEVARMQKPNWSDSGQEMPVYRVKLSELHYNEENGRIATWISIYTSNPDNPPLSSLDRDTFNGIIEGFIRKANTPESFKNLENDIKKKTQLNPGVILEDGTVVSGNRRFTVLRKLYEDENHDGKYEFFECFILPVPQSKQAKEDVKLIETKTQFGVVSEEDYNPIDRLVTIYRYLICEETKIWSVKDYAKKIGIKPGDAENLYNRALIMVDYLDYIGQPLAFHVARLQKLDGPIADLASLYKKLKTSQLYEWNRIKPMFYAEMNKGGDRTRNVRSLKSTYLKNKNEFDKRLMEMYAKQEEIERKVSTNTTVHTDFHEDEEGNKVPIVGLDDNSIREMEHATKKISAREKQIKKAESAFDSLSEIELDMIVHMPQDEKEKIKRTLAKIRTRLDAIERKL